MEPIESIEPAEPIVAAHLDAWNAPAGPARAQAIATVYSADVFIGEPQGALRGHDGMEHAIAALQAQVPGAVITRSGEIRVSQDLVTYRWALGPPGGPVVAGGRDVLILRDGQVASLYVVLDAP